jgi:hypothetical protein
MSSLFRTGILGGTFVLCATGVFWISISACESLSQTSPLPSMDASDLDAGQPPEQPDESSSSSSSGSGSSSGDMPVSARVRLANLLQGPDAIDLCTKVDAAGQTWQNGLITTNPANPDGAKPDGLFFGQTSQSTFVSSTGASGTKYLFKVVPPGTDCNDPTATVYAQITTSVAIRPGAGLTVTAVGEIKDGVDAGDATGKVTTIGDTLAPPGTATLFRVIHGVPDIAAFDVVVNGETLVTGVKYGNAVGYPYTSTTGYATIPAGIPEDATLTLRSGTTVRSFTIPERLRRGIASTVFVGGTADKLTVNLCSDRTPDKGDVASCTKLAAQQ